MRSKLQDEAGGVCEDLSEDHETGEGIYGGADLVPST